MMTIPFNSLMKWYLDFELPDHFLEQLPEGRLSDEADRFICRTLGLMKEAGFSAFDVTPLMVRQLTAIVPHYLPSSWNGKIPPLTAPGRHRKLDGYIKKSLPKESRKKRVLLDIGCGIPPLTTVDSAEMLSGWKIIGVDSAFAEFILYDSEENYGCFSPAGEILYLQSNLWHGSRFYSDNPESARSHFSQLFQALRAELAPPAAAKKSTSVEKEGNRLIHNHIADFESDNVQFLKADIRELKIPLVDAARCMNVLIYHPGDARKQVRAAMTNLLEKDGLLMVGTNNLFGLSCRYTVYQRDEKNLRPREFSFSLDNLRPHDILPWYALQEDDEEVLCLARLTRLIRSDRSFWNRFQRRVDRLLADASIYHRDTNGFLKLVEGDSAVSPTSLQQRVESIWKQLDEEGYTHEVAALLQSAGLHRWVNCVGDIAVIPGAHLRKVLARQS